MNRRKKSVYRSLNKAEKTMFSTTASEGAVFGACMYLIIVALACTICYFGAAILALLGIVYALFRD